MLMLLASASLASTPDVPRDPIAHQPEHPVQLGSRVGLWSGDRTAPGLGGHAKLRPFEEAGVSLFWNSFASPEDAWLWHDHVIGFSLFSPALVRFEDAFFSPTFGACVDFAFQTPLEPDLPTASDVAFGVHGGGMLELALSGPWSLEMSAQSTLYIDNDTVADRWGIDSRTGLATRWAHQAVVGVNLVL